ncbi:flagellar basal body L-ring protein FlgH [Planctomycetota bacterium]
MNKKITLIAVLLCFLLGSTQSLQADSLWAKRNKGVKYMYVDDTARKIGDILTILVVEDGTIVNKAKRTLEKKTSADSVFDGQLGFSTKHTPILPAIPAFEVATGTASNRTLDGLSKFDDSRAITDEIAVIVEDVMPNGNLVVLGSRRRDVAGDEQIIQISGIVRPSDISFANTVSSENVVNFHLVITNKGPTHAYTDAGWFNNIVDFLWPF